MLEREREEAIIHLLKQNTLASIHEIVKLTESSEATIRRDFIRLEKLGRILRVRGGVELSEQEKIDNPQISIELPFEYRKNILSKTKRKIAEAAVSLIGENEMILIDGGSTTYQMVDLLTNMELIILTNSFAIAEQMIKRGKSKIIIPEGVIYPESLLILNPLNHDPFYNYHASKVFIGVGGINKNKVTNTIMDLIQTERSMIEHADELIVLADSSKFGKSGNLFLCKLDRVSTIITDDGIREEETEAIREKGIKLIIV